MMIRLIEEARLNDAVLGALDLKQLQELQRSAASGQAGAPEEGDTPRSAAQFHAMLEAAGK